MSSILFKLDSTAATATLFLMKGPFLVVVVATYPMGMVSPPHYAAVFQSNLVLLREKITPLCNSLHHYQRDQCHL